MQLNHVNKPHTGQEATEHAAGFELPLLLQFVFWCNILISMNRFVDSSATYRFFTVKSTNGFVIVPI